MPTTTLKIHVNRYWTGLETLRVQGSEWTSLRVEGRRKGAAVVGGNVEGVDEKVQECVLWCVGEWWGKRKALLFNAM